MKHMDEITTIQISVKTKEELSKIGKMSDTYESVISRLIHEHYNLNIQPDLKQLKDSVDYPVNEERKQIALQLFEGILSLGNEIAFKLDSDSKIKPLIKARKNHVTFYKSNEPLCFVRTQETRVELYLPTEEENTEFPGWKSRGTINEFTLNGELEVIKRLYEDMLKSNDKS